MTCDTCTHGHKVWLHHGYRLECRKRAPSVFWGRVGLTGNADSSEWIMGPVTAWPEVSSRDKCGEYMSDGQLISGDEK